MERCAVVVVMCDVVTGGRVGMEEGEEESKCDDDSTTGTVDEAKEQEIFLLSLSLSFNLCLPSLLYTLTLSLSLSLSLSHTHTHTNTNTHTHAHACSLARSLAPSLPPSLPHSLTHCCTQYLRVQKMPTSKSWLHSSLRCILTPQCSNPVSLP